jgi:hypothetical protein
MVTFGRRLPSLSNASNGRRPLFLDTGHRPGEARDAQIKSGRPLPCPDATKREESQWMCRLLPRQPHRLSQRFTLPALARPLVLLWRGKREWGGSVPDCLTGEGVGESPPGRASGAKPSPSPMSRGCAPFLKQTLRCRTSLLVSAGGSIGKA